MKEQLPEIFFYPTVNRRGVPVLGVEFRSIEQSYSSLACIACGDETEIMTETKEFPYRNLGFIVRFSKIPGYYCNTCGLDTSPVEVGRQIEISLKFIFDSVGNRMRPVSLADIHQIFPNRLLQESKQNNDIPS